MEKMILFLLLPIAFIGSAITLMMIFVQVLGHRMKDVIKDVR